MEREEIKDESMRKAREQTLVRLRSAGIELDEHEDPEQLVMLLEAVEQFEDAVRDRGGDLMVDEPPPGEEVEPDDPRFVLPVRRADETLPTYRARIQAAAEELRGDR